MKSKYIFSKVNKIIIFKILKIINKEIYPLNKQQIGIIFKKLHF